MPCEWKDGIVLLCSRRSSRVCHICGSPMVALCDATKKDGAPCNAPLCEKHRYKVGEDVDVCKYHNHPKYIQTALKNRASMEERENRLK